MRTRIKKLGAAGVMIVGLILAGCSPAPTVAGPTALSVDGSDVTQCSGAVAGAAAGATLHSSVPGAQDDLELGTIQTATLFCVIQAHTSAGGIQDAWKIAAGGQEAWIWAPQAALATVETKAAPLAQVIVPDLANKSLEEATAALLAAKLTLSTVANVESDDSKKDLVIGQDPNPGATVSAYTGVAVKVGKGVALIKVPNVVSYSSEDARRVLNDLGLTYIQVLVKSNAVDKDRALNQDPVPQAQVQPGSTVTVTIGSGP